MQLVRVPLAAVLLVALAATEALGARPKWHQLEGYTFAGYVKDFGKGYAPGTKEYEMREALFTARLADVRAFNARGGSSYKKGINHMSDWSESERLSQKGWVPGMVELSKPVEHFVRDDKVSIPDSLDYRKWSPAVLTTVKDQGQCGSCWAHAATESIETATALRTGELLVLSQQQVSACTPNPLQCGGQGGCLGATAELAINYIRDAGGITQEWTYPYQQYFGDTGSCAVNLTKMKTYATVSGYGKLPRNSLDDTLAALVSKGPLAISVDASQWSDYEEGVYEGCDYSKNISMDHAVQLIGYGRDMALQMDYWLVRNSWSATWGESGYIRLYREPTTPQCGWNVDWTTMGGGCPGLSNTTVYACGQCGILFDVLYAVSSMPV